MKKTVAFYTFGCRLNQAETARFRRWYLNQGWREVDWREADRVVVNTCAVTGKAEREVRSFLRRVKRENPKAEMWVMGCWINKLKTQNSKVKTTTQNLKFLFSFAQDKDDFGSTFSTRLIDNEEKGKMLREMGSEVVGVVKAGYEKAFIKIQEGCDNFCTFCLVPYLRGRSRSEPADYVVSQVKRLVGKVLSHDVSHQLRKNGRSSSSDDAVLYLTAGDPTSWLTTGGNHARRLFRKVFLSLDEKHLRNIFSRWRNLFGMTGDKVSFAQDGGDRKTTPIRWVVLTGVDIAQYRDGEVDLLGLIERVLAETEVKKLGLGSIYPTFGLNGGVEWLAKLFEKYGERLEKRLHISLQSGSESVLRRMGRKTTAKQFAEVVEELRKKIPGMVITTDVIVGFPGETEEEFEESLAFVKRMRFDKLHVFRYSPREGTVAARMLGKKGWEHVPERVVKERARRMREVVVGHRL